MCSLMNSRTSSNMMRDEFRTRRPNCVVSQPNRSAGSRSIYSGERDCFHCRDSARHWRGTDTSSFLCTGRNVDLVIARREASHLSVGSENAVADDAAITGDPALGNGATDYQLIPPIPEHPSPFGQICAGYGKDFACRGYVSRSRISCTVISSNRGSRARAAASGRRERAGPRLCFNRRATRSGARMG